MNSIRRRRSSGSSHRGDDVTVVEDGLVTIIEFQNDGYAHLSF